jgi:signal transduction histidine kinase
MLAVSLNFDLSTARDTLLVTAVVIAGIGLVMGPWVIGLINDLTEERRARIRSEERTEVAAHLHDSVLQTLSLIQRRAVDPRVVTLARKQERELRSWLYGRSGIDTSSSLRDRLEQEMAEIEDLHEVPIEVVVVGDTPLNDDLSALVAAAREAAANAAVHSGASTVDVFAEIGADSVEVFVRDTGVGFDPDAVPDDRRGLADSIIGRVEHVGGTATVHSSPGEGTEVELQMRRSGR